MEHQPSQMRAMLKSWFNVFLGAAIASFLALIIDNNTLALELKAIEAIVISGLVAVLPVIKNYLDSSDHRYGRGFEEE
jgi:hypothetical protein